MITSREVGSHETRHITHETKKRDSTERAPGSEDSTGLGKCRVASTTASAEDWMPVSTDVVRATRSEYPRSLGTSHPKRKPLRMP
jgi:hypothetical protein